MQKQSDTIEEVTDEILLELIEDHEYVAVYFSGDCDEGDKCDTILEDLENIDDELDEAGILFVTTEDTCNWVVSSNHFLKLFEFLF